MTFILGRYCPVLNKLDPPYFKNESQTSIRCCKFRNFVSLLQLYTVNTLAHQNKEHASKQAEEDGDRSQEE